MKRKLNFKHLSETGFSYLEHLRFTIEFSIYFLYGSITSLIHGIYPDIFTTTIRKMSLKILNKIREHDIESDKRMRLKRSGEFSV